jgi:chromatin remodeling complex protein RSC6
MTDKSQAEKDKMDKKLDDALKDSFPSSDPISISEPAPVKKKPEAAKKH